MNISRLIFISAILLIFKSYGQTKITGRVTDGNNNPIELAMVKLKELNRIAMTNDSGIFRMTLPSNQKKDKEVTILVIKQGYKDAIKQVNISDSLIIIKLTSLNVADTVKITVKQHPVATIDYFQNGIAVKQSKGTINRKIDQENAKDMVMYLPDKNEPINITCIAGDQEALGFAEQIKDFLTLNGYKKIGEVTQATFAHSITGQFLNRDKTGVTITVGHKPEEKY